MSANPPKTFDERILNLRRQRAAKAFNSAQNHTPDFLLDHVAEDLIERLQTVNRHFDQATDLFGQTGKIATALSSLKSVSSVKRIETANHVSPNSAQPVSISDFQPFKLAPLSADLIVSAFSLHWSNDLQSALSQIKLALRPDGLFLGILPGPATLSELRQCFALAESELWGGVSPRIDPFVTLQTAGSLLQQAGFTLPVIDTDTIIVRYDNAQKLMHDLRAMGVTNTLYSREKHRSSRTLFSEVCKIYKDKFCDGDGRIRATFEFISLSGWAPHSSQQIPLEPGSATTRLADILKPADDHGE